MDVQELASYFVHHITKSKIGVEGRVNSACSSISLLLEKGWTIKEIKKELDEFAQQYPDIVINIYHVDEIMGKKEVPGNLMEKDVFYYHRQLQNMSNPPVIKYDSKTGELAKQSERFHLEMKDKYTLKDLLSYWYQKMNITPNGHLTRQDEGKFKYMLGNYSLDEILFAIDISTIIRKELNIKMLRNAFELEKYIEHARDLIDRKKNIYKVQGINREFKRKQSYKF